MRTKESVSRLIADIRFGHGHLARNPVAATELGGLDMLNSLLWQPGDRDDSTLALYEQMARACEDGLELIAERLEGEAA